MVKETTPKKQNYLFIPLMKEISEMIDFFDESDEWEKPQLIENDGTQNEHFVEHYDIEEVERYKESLSEFTKIFLEEIVDKQVDEFIAERYENY